MRRSIHQLYFITVIIFICTSAQGNYPSDQSGEESVSPDGLFSDPGSALLSMDIKDEPLKEVLERISDQNGITFLLPPSLAEEKVMMRFSNLTLEEGLNKILSPYNRIFIYLEPKRPAESSVARLKEVRIFPHQYEGRVKEPLMRIAEGTSESKGAARSESKEKDNRAASRDDGRRGETYVETLTTTLKGRDREAKLDALKVLRDAGTVDAVRALSFAIRDRDPRVKTEAVSALRALGEEIIGDQRQADDPDNLVTENNSDEDDTNSTGGGNNRDDEDKQTQGAPSVLSLASTSRNSASIALSNEVNVGGVQFKVGGTQVTEVRTTARTEGFLATFDQKSGTVILADISGQTIAPGTGPIVEIVHSGGPVNITDKTVGEKP
jgi:type II secretory pathway component GspD/PulD (secretin)